MEYLNSLIAFFAVPTHLGAVALITLILFVVYREYVRYADSLPLAPAEPGEPIKVVEPVKVEAKIELNTAKVEGKKLESEGVDLPPYLQQVADGQDALAKLAEGTKRDADKLIEPAKPADNKENADGKADH